MERELLKEQQKTNELLEKLVNQNNENDLLTINQVHQEYGIGINMVRKMFNDEKLAVQKYTIPFKVTRKAMQDYMKERHDYLCEK